jgi:hypothetical protein
MLTLLVFVWLAQLPGDQDRVVFTAMAIADGMHWETQVRKSVLDAMPRWDPDVSDSPAVGPAQAMRAAKEIMSQLSLKTWPDRWRVDTVTLRPTIAEGVWIYVVNFNESPPPCNPPPGWGCGGSWGGSPMQIVVLPNGRALMPVAVNTRSPFTP